MKPSTPDLAQASPFAAVAFDASPAAPCCVQVVRHPADGDRLGHAEALEILLDADRRTDEIPRFAHPHRLRPERQHQRGFGVAAVDAVGALLRRKESLRVAERVPAGVHREHAAADAQLPHDGGEDGDIAAMRIDEYELPAAGPGDALADLGPGARDRLHGKGQRPRVLDVLVRLADRLKRQDKDRQVGGNARDRPGQIALVDEGVDADRQMRPVLLDRGDRQDRDDLAHVRCGEVAPAHFRPELRRKHADPLHAVCAAIASISTLNSGRAKP